MGALEYAIKVYGERNCGTNLLEQLIEKNFGVSPLRYYPPRYMYPLLRFESMVGWIYRSHQNKYLGWKHGAPPIEAIEQYKGKLLIITLCKNPYSFLLSLHRNPYHFRGNRNMSFPDFLRCDWTVIKRDNLKPQQAITPIELWNMKTERFTSLSKSVKQPVLNLRYEDLLESQETILKQISEVLGTSSKSFRTIHQSTKKDGRTTEDFLNYYQREKWKTKLDRQTVETINRSLDLDLVSALGYEAQNPDAF